MLYNISLLLIYFIHYSLHLLIPFLYLAPSLSPPDTELIWIISWVLNHLLTIFPTSCFPTQNFSYTSSWSILSKNSSEDFSWLQQRGGNPKFSVWTVGSSICLPHSPSQSILSLIQRLCFILPSLWKPKFHHPFMTNSNTISPQTLPSNFFASSELSEYNQFSCSVMSDTLWPHGLQHARPPCPSPTSRACSNSCPLSRRCHPTISSSVIPFSFCLQSFPASESFPVSQFFALGGQSIRASDIRYLSMMPVTRFLSVIITALPGWFLHWYRDRDFESLGTSTIPCV